MRLPDLLRRRTRGGARRGTQDAPAEAAADDPHPCRIYRLLFVLAPVVRYDCDRDVHEREPRCAGCSTARWRTERDRESHCARAIVRGLRRARGSRRPDVGSAAHAAAPARRARADPDARHTRGRGRDPRHDPRRRCRGAGLASSRPPMMSRSTCSTAAPSSRSTDDAARGRARCRAQRDARSSRGRVRRARSCRRARLPGDPRGRPASARRAERRERCRAAAVFGGLRARPSCGPCRTPSARWRPCATRSRRSCSSSARPTGCCRSPGCRPRTASAPACCCRWPSRPSRCCSRRRPQSEPLFEALAATSRRCCSRPRRSTPSSRTTPSACRPHKPLATLRIAVAGAEGMPERLIPRIRTVLGTEVIVGYGLTEIFQFALAGRSDDPGARAGRLRQAAGRRPGPARRRGWRSGRRRRDRHARAAVRLAVHRLLGQVKARRTAGELRADGWFTTRDRFMIDKRGHLRSLRAGRRPVQGRRQVGLVRTRSSAR